jgi:transposase
MLGPCPAQVFDLARINQAPIAVQAVARIDALFAIECEINGVTAKQRCAVYPARSRPSSALWRLGCASNVPLLSSKNETAKAIDYSLKGWPALTRFLDDERLCMSNNAAERAACCCPGPQQLDLRRLR